MTVSKFKCNYSSFGIPGRIFNQCGLNEGGQVHLYTVHEQHRQAGVIFQTIIVYCMLAEISIYENAKKSQEAIHHLHIIQAEIIDVIEKLRE